MVWICCTETPGLSPGALKVCPPIRRDWKPPPAPRIGRGVDIIGLTLATGRWPYLEQIRIIKNFRLVYANYKYYCSIYAERSWKSLKEEFDRDLQQSEMQYQHYTFGMEIQKAIPQQRHPIHALGIEVSRSREAERAQLLLHPRSPALPVVFRALSTSDPSDPTGGIHVWMGSWRKSNKRDSEGVNIPSPQCNKGHGIIKDSKDKYEVAWMSRNCTGFNITGKETIKTWNSKQDWRSLDDTVQRLGSKLEFLHTICRG